MDKEEMQRKFFYAADDANFYNETIELVVPKYRELHEIMLRFASAARGIHDTTPPRLALDLGSGTGADALPLLAADPNVLIVGVDASVEMHDAFASGARASGIAATRYELVAADLLDERIEYIVRERALRRFSASQFSVVQSAFTFHHFTNAQRAKMFGLVHSLLAPGGIFLLGDLFNYSGESTWLTEQVFRWETEWITANFDNRIASESATATPALAQHLRRLRDRWLAHYRNDNQLDSISGQLRQLVEAGFGDVGNPLRYWQVGLICARK